MIFSGRKTLRLGDTLRYEILNIPESENTEKFTVQLRLYDIDRNVIGAEGFSLQRASCIDHVRALDFTTEAGLLNWNS